MSVKEITVEDCLNLQKKFQKYCKLILVMDTIIQKTIDKIVECGKVEDQSEVRSMFRVVLKYIGEDPTTYNEPTERSD